MERRLMATMEAGMTTRDLRLSVAAALFWDPDARGGHHRQGRAGPREQRRRTFWLRAFGGCRTVRDSPAAIGAVGHWLATPFGLDRNVWELLLSLPVLLAARGFFTGAARALRQRTLDMNVLVATSVGISWAYSAAVTFGLSGDVFYDAGAMLATFVPLGHWFEMRARGSAAGAIRALLDLAPPTAVVVWFRSLPFPVLGHPRICTRRVAISRTNST
jgi:P-type Cu2+ transporter